MGQYWRGPHTFHFDYELERDEEILEVAVAYSIEDGDDLWIESVKHNGREIDTTADEDKELLNYIRERVEEDLMDAEACYGDYLYDLRRDMEG